MPVSPYTRPYSDTGQQGLIDSLTAETIFLGGWDVVYLPRKDAVEEDKVFGQSQQLKYDSTFNVAVLIENTDGFEGEGEFYSKFGLEIKDRMRLTMSRKTWEDIKVQDTYGSAYSTDQWLYDTFLMEMYTFGSRNDAMVTEDGHTLALETGSQASLRTRPFEGDLVFFPFNKKLFQITFVEHETPFYPGGIRPQYQMVCDLLEYSNEIFNTGIQEIDSIEDSHAQGRVECYVSTEEGYGEFQRGEIIYKTSAIGVDDHSRNSPSARVLSHDISSGKLVVVPRNGGFAANDVVVGSAANLAEQEIVVPLALEAEEGKMLTEDGVDNLAVASITASGFRRLTFIPAGSFMGDDPLTQQPIVELDSPADVLAQNEEFEEVATLGEEETVTDVESGQESTRTESFIDFSEIDPFSDGNF